MEKGERQQVHGHSCQCIAMNKKSGRAQAMSLYSGLCLNSYISMK